MGTSNGNGREVINGNPVLLSAPPADAVTPNLIAQELGFSVSAVLKWIRTGKLAAHVPLLELDGKGKPVLDGEGKPVFQAKGFRVCYVVSGSEVRALASGTASRKSPVARLDSKA